MKGCDRCDGGWRTVTEGYVDRLAPIPTALDLAPFTEEEQGAILYLNGVKRAALRDSVYPCSDCNSSAFYRWAGGHLEANHDRGRCLECVELDKARGHRRSRSAPRDLVRDGPTDPLPPMERRDLDF